MQSNNYQLVCIRRLINISVLLLLRHILLERKIQYNENWKFLFCLSICHLLPIKHRVNEIIQNALEILVVFNT